MGGADTLKTLIVALAMAVLAFVVGSLAADGRLQSSMLPIMGIIGGFALLYLGKNSWWLVFIVPAISSFLPISSIGGLPLAQLTAVTVFAYWLVMWVMGYVSVKWRNVIWLDIPVFLFFGYFAYTYVMHPVDIGSFDEDAEFIGGKDYVFMLLGMLTYCAISLIPCSISQVLTITKWTIWLSVGLTFFKTLRGSADMGAAGIAARAEGGRFGLFSGLGGIAMRLLCAWNSPLKLIFTPKKLFLFTLAVFCIAMGGWREVLLGAGVYVAVCALAHRQLFVLVGMGAVALSCLYYLSEEEVLMEAPYGVQRVLTPIPGLKLKKEVLQDAGHSSEWRKEMWRWALDPRMGYIRDYVWGDGFGLSRETLRLNTININRGKMNSGDQSFFAETGTWHSGVILTIHRIGYVGLVFLGAWIAASVALVIRLGMCLNGRKEQPYALYLTADYVGMLLLFCISAGTYSVFFGSIVSLAFAKVFYVEGMKEGIIQPLFSRKLYVPLMMRDDERQRLQQARKNVQVIERH